MDLFRRAGYASDLAVSQLSVWYRSFDVTLFKDALNDLGWFGPNDVRPWYTGKPSS